MFDGEAVPGSLAEADAALTHPVESEAVAAEPAAQPEGQPRDEAGRFTSTPQAESEAPQEGDAAPAPDQTGEPTETPEGETAEGEDYPTASYRADGQEFDIPGSAVGEDGVFIPPETWQSEVLPLLSAGKAAFGSVRERLSEAASREQQALDRATAAEAQATHLLAKFEEMVEKSQHANTLDELLKTPMGEWLLGVRQNWPILKAEAKSKAIELSQQQAAKELQQYRDREQQQKLRPLMEQTLQSSIRTQAAEFGLDENTLGAVWQTLSSPEYEGYLFVKAPYDDPANGIRKGETVIDHGVVRSALRLASINRAPVAQQQKIQAAVAQNAKQNAPVKVPPTVGGKGRAPRQAGLPKVNSAREADDFLLHGNLDELEVEGLA